MGKKFKIKSISYLIEMLLGCCLHSFNDFLLYVILRCRQADVFATASSVVSLISAINFSPVSWNRCKFIADVVDTHKQLIPTGNNTGDKHKV
jgi:hypothetical protein